MSLQEKITNDMREAMKNGEHEKRILLSVVVSEFSRVGKVLTDEQVIKVLKKMHENAIEVKNTGQAYIELDFEIAILEAYLPKKMSESDIISIVVKLIDEKSYTRKDTGKIMKDSKELLGVSFDGKLLQEVIKKLP